MKHNAKLMQKHGKNMTKLIDVLNMLASGKPLPPKFNDHQHEMFIMQSRFY